MVLKLGVNIDHVATLRQARYRDDAHGQMTPEPDPVTAAKICLAAGAHGITIHLREDRRHIHEKDVERIRRVVGRRLNFEMAATPEITAIACRIRPVSACIVPEKRAEVTTEGGLDVIRQSRILQRIVETLHARKILVSFFINPDAQQIRRVAQMGADFIELHTGAFANARGARQRQELQKLRKSAIEAHSLGLQVNVGHGINYENIRGILTLPHLAELNIGHAILSRALWVGLGPAVREMLTLMKGYRSH